MRSFGLWGWEMSRVRLLRVEQRISTPREAFARSRRGTGGTGNNGEAILFYEYRQGNVELQFEFWDGKRLSHLNLALDGALSVEEQRAAYGVARSWPPEEIAMAEADEPRPAPIAANSRLMPIRFHVVLDTVVALGGMAQWSALIVVFWPFNLLARIVPSKDIRGALPMLACARRWGAAVNMVP
jgi:hypothetical protein